MHPKTLAPPLPLVLRLRTRSLNPNPPLRRRPARFPFASASIARARKAMAWEASLMAPRSCSLKAPRCTTPCARPALPFPVRPRFVLLCKRHQRSRREAMRQRKRLDICRERVFPGKACGRYTLSGGESISWIYSTEKNPTMAMWPQLPMQTNDTIFDRYHPAVALIYCGVLLAFSMAAMHPVYLLATFAGLVAYNAVL